VFTMVPVTSLFQMKLALWGFKIRIRTMFKIKYYFIKVRIGTSGGLLWTR
jgi:hypothetical protein